MGEVTEWLEAAGLKQYAPRFEAEGITTAKDVMALSTEDLTRRKLVKSVHLGVYSNALRKLEERAERSKARRPRVPSKPKAAASARPSSLSDAPPPRPKPSTALGERGPPPVVPKRSSSVTTRSALGDLDAAAEIAALESNPSPGMLARPAPPPRRKSAPPPPVRKKSAPPPTASKPMDSFYRRKYELLPKLEGVADTWKVGRLFESLHLSSELLANKRDSTHPSAESDDDHLVRVLKCTLRGLGLTNEAVLEMTATAVQLKHTSDTLQSRRHVVHQTGLVMVESYKFLRLQMLRASVARLQAIVRGFLVRQRLRRVTRTFEGGRATLRERNERCRDLLLSETAYIEHLEQLAQCYAIPTREKNLLPKHEHEGVFGNIEEVLYISHMMRMKLRAMMDTVPSVSGVADVFLQTATSLKVYGTYLNNFKHAMDTVARVRTEYAQFDALVARADEGLMNQGVDLMSLMTFPLNRISQYKMLLEKVDALTPPGHVDRHALDDAVVMIDSTSDYVRRCFDESENRAALLHMSRTIRGYPFMKVGRVVLCDRTPTTVATFEGSKKKEDGRERIMFLLNDALLLCKLDKGEREAGHFKEEYPVRGMERVEDSSQLFVRNYSFTLHMKSGQSVRAAMKDSEEKARWIAHLDQLIGEQFAKRVFGVPLDDILRVEGATVPNFVTMCGKFLLDHALQSEGLFRVAGEKSQLQALRQAVNEGDVDDAVLADMDPNVVASSLKLWFREMPEPLLTFALYPAITEAYNIKDPAHKLAELRGILTRLPEANRNVFKFLFELLARVAHEPANKMTPKNLAIVFGPNILRPEEDTILSSLNIVKVNDAVEMLISDTVRLLFEKKSLPAPPPRRVK